MMFDDQLEDKMLKALRDAGVSEDVYWRAYVRGQELRKQYRRRKPVSSFPFSLVEQLFHWLLDGTERRVDRLVRRVARRFSNKRQ